MKIVLILAAAIMISAGGSYPQAATGNNINGRVVRADSLNTRELTLTPFSNFGNNIVHSFTGTGNIILQAAGIASSYAIIATNLDYHVSTYFRDHEFYSNIALPAVVAGSTLPVTVGAFLYIYGKYTSDNRMVGASFAVLQAGLITVSYISILKGITGRAHPDPNSPLDREEVSESFNFGLVRGGIYRGWPSGHVGGTMAVASTLAGYYPEKTWLKYVGYGWVAYTMASVSAFHKGTMHWLSDAIAAGFMTYSIGQSVGSYFRDEIPANTEEIKFRFLPIVESDYTGIYLGYSF